MDIKKGQVIQFPLATPPEVARYGTAANAWADAERRRLGFKMQPVRWEHPEDYKHRDGVMVSLFPIEGTDEAMLRTDWFAAQRTKYVRLVNYAELRQSHPQLINHLLSNGIALYLANCQDA